MPTLINDGHPFLGRDCTAVGLSRSQLSDAVKARRLREVFTYVYADVSAADTRAFRLAAARLVAPPAAVVCDSFASWLHLVDTFKPSERHRLTPTFVVPHGTTRSAIDGIDCRQAILPDSDITEIDGTAVTSALRTTTDLLRKLWRPYALAAADGMAHASLVAVPDVIDSVRRLRGFPGIVQARSLAPLIEPLAQSAGESWQRLRLIDAGFPLPKAQHPVRMPDGSFRFLDLAYPQLLVASEYDGREFHTLDEDKDHDEDRRALLSRLWANAGREEIFGNDPAFEIEVGKLIGIEPLPRSW